MAAVLGGKRGRGRLVPLLVVAVPHVGEVSVGVPHQVAKIIIAVPHHVVAVHPATKRPKIVAVCCIAIIIAVPCHAVHPATKRTKRVAAHHIAIIVVVAVQPATKRVALLHPILLIVAVPQYPRKWPWLSVSVPQPGHDAGYLLLWQCSV